MAELTGLHTGEKFTEWQHVAVGDGATCTGKCVFNAIASTNNGGALQADKDARVIIDGSTFSKNKALIDGTTKKGGGAVYLANCDSALTADNCSTISQSLFTGNTASGNGGALYVGTNNKLELTGSTFTSNTSAVYGGAIYNTGSLTITSSYFSKNIGSTAGAIYNDKAGTVEVSNSTFTGNRSNGKSGGYSGVVDNHGTAKFTGCTFTGNSSGYGGIVFNVKTITFEDCIFNGNSASNGGVVRNASNGTVTVKDSSFLTAKDTMSFANGYLYLLGSNTFAANISGGTKSYFYATGSTLNFVNTEKITVTGPIVFAASSTGNIININGGNIEFKLVSGETRKWDFSNVTFNFNNSEAITVTGALTDLKTLNFNGKEVIFATAQDFSSTAVTINCALADDVYRIAKGTLGTDTFSVNGTAVTLVDNVAEVAGTGYYLMRDVDDGNRLLLTKYTVKENASNCVTTVSDVVESYDQVISLREAAITYKQAQGTTTVTFDDVLTGSTVTLDSYLTLAAGNTVSLQGNANGTTIQGRINNSGVLEIKGDSASQISFAGQITTDANGGVIRNAGTLDVTAANFTGNTASTYGGAVYNAGTVNVSGSTFSGNYAGVTGENLGGAVYNTGSMTISGSLFAGNFSEDWGGAVFSSGTMTIDNCVFDGNRAGNDSGAIRNSVAASVLTIKDSSFLTADDKINIGNGTIIFEGNNFFAADIRGGSITATDSTATFINSETITVSSALTGLAALNFNGKEVIFSTEQDFSSTAVTINCALVDDVYRIAKGTLGTDTFSVNGTAVTLADNVAKVADTDYYLMRDVADGNRLLLTKCTVKENASNCVTTVSDVVESYDQVISLREAAITYGVESGVTEVTFADALTGSTVTLDSDLTLAAGGTVSLQGNANGTTVQGRINNSGILEIKGTSASQISFAGQITTGDDGSVIRNAGIFDVTGADFSGNTVANNGGVICNASGTVSISDSIFSGNYAGNDGGAVYNAKGATASISGSTFTGNTAGRYSGVFDNRGVMTVKGSTFTGNSATYGGAVFNYGTIIFEDCVFDGNYAKTKGGAIRNASYGKVTLQDCSFLTSADKMSFANGSMTLLGSNFFAADIDCGTVTATGSTLNFINTEKIKVSSPLTFEASASGNIVNINGSDIEFSSTTLNLANAVFNFNNSEAITVTGALTGLKTVSFNGDTVNFASDFDLTGASVSIDCELPTPNTTLTVASGVTNLDKAASLSVHGNTVTDGSVTVDGNPYVLNYADGKLEISFNAKTATKAGSVEDNGTPVIVGGNTAGYAAVWTENTTIESSVFAAGSNTADNIYLQLDGIESNKVILGGGNSGERAGKNDIKLSCGTVSTIYGGGYNQSEAAVELKLAGGSVTGDIFGGSRVTEGTVAVDDVEINVSGSAFADGTSIYGTGFASGTGVVLNNTTTDITVSGGNLGEAKAGEGIFGVGFADNGAQVNAGTVTIDLSSGTVGNVFGGGWAQKGGSASATSVEINVSGEVSGANVYGGGAHSNSSSGNSTTVDSVAITITNNSNFESVFAGGQISNTVGSDMVEKNAVITVTGSFDEAFTTNLYGGGYGGSKTVSGVSTLDFSYFTGSVTGKVYDFDVIKFSGNGSTDLSEASVEAPANGWVLDFTERTSTAIAASLDSLESGVSMLTSDNLLAADTWQLFSASTDAFGSDWSMYINGTSVKLDENVTLGGTDWTLTKIDSNDQTKTTSVITLSKVVK